MRESMMSTGRPLDVASAAQRAAQIAALADPTRLRLLSQLVTSDNASLTASALAALLEADVAEVIEMISVLVDAGLLVSAPAAHEVEYIPTADAWIRFGRLLALPRVDPSPGHLPASVDSTSTLPPAIESIVDRMSYRFSTYFSRETVQKYVADSYGLLRDRATVSRHLPSLTSRFAADRLGALATAQGFALSGTPEVLFVCVQNAGRSQIAAALMKHLAGGRVHVRTAGSKPTGSIDPAVIDVLDEVGVPVEAEFPKPLTDEVVQAADVVVTMGCGDACPVYPGRRYLDWPVEDPVGRSMDELRAIRNDIQSRVEGLLESLGISV